MSYIFYSNMRLSLLATSLIVISGILSLKFLPRMEDPLLTPRVASITTFLPGADTELVSSLVTEKIEQELKEIEEIKEVTSNSRPSTSFITLELKDDVGPREVNDVWSRVRDKLEDAKLELPEEATKPEFDQLKAKANALIVALKWRLTTPPNYSLLTRYSQQLKDLLERIRGTEKGELYGEPIEEITVTVQPDVAASLGLSVRSISETITTSDVKFSAGRMRNSVDELSFEVDGDIDGLTRLGRIPISLGTSGERIELGQFAEIHKSVRSPLEAMVLLEGQPAIALGLMIDSQTQLDRWTADVNRVLVEFEQQLPSEIELVTVFEQIPYVTERMASLVANLGYGALGILSVIWLMMGWRCALIVSISLPLGCLMVMSVMYAAGIPVHQMSITGLIISLGLMIDNAIVTVDEIDKELRRGLSRRDAVARSIRFLAVPLLGSTLTTIFSFGPIALMKGPSGEFVGSIAMVTIISITCSLLLALTLIAAFAGRMLRLSQRSHHPIIEFGFGYLARLYQGSLRIVFRHPLLGVTIPALISIAGFLAAAGLDEQFFPPSERKQFQLELELHGTSSIEDTWRVAEMIQSQLESKPSINKVSWFLGESAPVFYYNVVPDRENSPRYGQAIVDCRDDVNVIALIGEVQRELSKEFPEVALLARQLEQGPPFSAPIEVQLLGPDPNKLRMFGEQVRLVLTDTPDVVLTRSSFDELIPKVRVSVNEMESRLVGLDQRRVAVEMNAMLEGVTGGSILEGPEQLPVRVRIPSRERGDLSQIASMNFVSSKKQQGSTGSLGAFRGVPFESFGTITLGAEQGNQLRSDGRLMNEIQAYITAGVLPAIVLEDFKSRIEKIGFQLPAGYEMQFAGASAKRQEAVGSLIVNTVVLICLMISTLVLATKSFRSTGILFAVAGLSVGYGLGALWLTDMNWGFMSIVGIMGMIGIAVNDSIVMLAGLKDSSFEIGSGEQDLVRCVSANTRHILATSLTTTIGFAPLILNTNSFWPPVAVSISGGVIGATILAIVFVPSLYMLLHRSGKSASCSLSTSNS